MALRGRVPALYKDGCDPGLTGVFVQPCQGGDAAGGKVLVLLGDSHAGQWASAFDAIARAQGWRLLLFTKSGCPMVEADFHYERLGRLYTECSSWRDAVLKEIAALRPALVVVSGSEHYPFSARTWEEGERRVASALAAASDHLLILRDTPWPGINIPNCLARKLWQPAVYRSDCSFSPGDAALLPVDAAHKAVVQSLPNAAYLDMTSTICPQPRCNVMAGELVKFRDANHLSDAYASSLTAELQRHMVRLGLLPPENQPAARP